MLLALLGLLVLSAVVLQGLERLAPREAGSIKKQEAGSSEPRAVRPTLERVDDWMILVTAGIMLPVFLRTRYTWRRHPDVEM